MLTLDRLTVRQGGFRLAADLTLPPGSVTALLGPSGGGKSTLLAAIAGFLRPDAGRVLWQGADLTPLTPGERPVSILFQDNNLFAHLTVAQNLALGLRPSGRLTEVEKVQVNGMLDRVGLSGLAGRKPGALSGGQQGRAALARVLLSSRPLVLLDEPFAALGPGQREEMLVLAANMLAEAGRTLLLVTHDPDDARRIADAVVAVVDGMVHAPVPTAAFLANPPPQMRAYLGSGTGRAG